MSVVVYQFNWVHIENVAQHLIRVAPILILSVF